jgi:hypothetical protein
MKHSLLAGIVSIFGSLYSVPEVLAQSRLPTVSPQVSDQMVEDLRKRVRQISAGVDRGIVSMRDQANVPKGPQREVLHYRGKEGIAFPAPTEVVVVAVRRMSDAELEAAARRVIARDAEAQEKEQPARKPPPCSGQKLVIENRPSGAPGTLFLDLLYLPTEKVPNDPKDVFGPKVSIYQYKDSGDVTAYENMSIQGVTCLPYRLRILGNKAYRFEGKSALQYLEITDDRPRGKIHPWVRDKFPQY